MKKFEYIVISFGEISEYCGDGYVEDLRPLEYTKILNSYGDDGWELIHEDEMKLIFKKRKLTKLLWFNI